MNSFELARAPIQTETLEDGYKIRRKFPKLFGNKSKAPKFLIL